MYENPIAIHPAVETAGFLATTFSKLTKEHGLDRRRMNSIAVHLYNMGEGHTNDVVDIFNSWTAAKQIRFSDPMAIVVVLDYIRKLCKVSHKDLEKALLYDHLIPGGIYCA